MNPIKKIFLFLIFITLLGCETKIDDNTAVTQTEVSNYGENPLCLNNKCPSKSGSNNVIIDHDIFILSYNLETKFADWVAYKAEVKNLNGNYKKRIWKKDHKLTPEHALIPSDYKGGYNVCGYDRGHQAPLAHFNNHEHAPKTNYLSNITPQLAKLNRGAWKRLEDRVRLLAKQNKGEVFVITGTYYIGKLMCQLPNARLKHIVPNGYWKIIALKDGENIKYSSFSFPQETVDKDYCKYRTSVQKIKKLTGISFPLNNQSANNSLSSDLGCSN